MVEHDGQHRLQLLNRGQAHLQLTGLSLHAAQAPAPRSAPALYAHDKTLYLLPGQLRELPMPDQPAWATAEALSLRAQTDNGAQEWPVPSFRH